MCPLFAFLDFNPVMMLVLGAIAVMLFGERLPEVARSIGKGLMQFKTGIRELQDELHKAVSSATSVDPPKPSTAYYGEPEDREEATAPKFEPPPTT
jgi:sec-independent protein translocase protein TatA